MTLTKAMIDALINNGGTLEQLAAIVMADLDEQEAQRTRRRKGNAERQRESRENRRAGRSQPVTTCHSDPPIDIHTPSPPDISPSGESQGATGEREFLEMWASTAKPLRLPCPRAMTPKLRRAYRARVRDTGAPEIQRAIERIPKSAFLRGDAGNWNGANLDFLLRPDNIRRINEGQFDDRTNSDNRPSRANGADNRSSLARAIDEGIGFLGTQAGVS